MGHLHSGTARVVRGVRPVTKPFKAAGRKASDFADKVSFEVQEQDLRKAQRKAARKNMKAMVQVIASMPKRVPRVPVAS